MVNKYLKQLTLLYVEDEQVAREELEEYLKIAVGKLYVAKDGEEALALFKEYHPDIVLTDISMPKMNGLEMSKRIKQLSILTPIIVATAFDNSKYMVEAIEIGIDGYMLKPLNLQTMSEKLNQTAKHLVSSVELKKSEKLLKEYKKAVDEGSIVSKTDKNGIITYVNQQFCDISGYTKEELIGSSHNIVRHPDEKSDIYRELWQTIKEKKVWKGKIRNLSKDGSGYYITAVIMPILDENGELIEYIALRQDITEIEKLNSFLEHRVEDEVNKNSQKDKEHIKTLTSFLENSPNPIIIYDNEKVRFANRKFLNIIHKDSDELVGSSFKLDSIFEERKGTISSLDEIDENPETNKVSISMNVGRHIYYLIVSDVKSADAQPLKMYTFNNITLVEYQQLKISHYSERLEDFIQKSNKVMYMQDSSVKSEIVHEDVTVEDNEIKRTLDSKEKDVLKRSRNNVAVSSIEYSKEIDSYVIQEIDELIDLETEINESLTEFEQMKGLEQIHDIGAKLLKYSSTIALLLEFEDLSFAINSLGDLLLGLEKKDIEETKVRKIELFLSNILLDLSNWRRTVFVDFSANDIHYLDSSLFSTILQFELIFNDADAIEDEDDFELF